MEVRSETGIMSGREVFGVATGPVQTQPPATTMQGMRLTYASDGTQIYKPITSSAQQSAEPTQPAGDPMVTTAEGSNGNTNGSSSPSGMPPVVAHGLNMNMGEPLKRKRGRPRKYGPDGSMALALSPVSAPGSIAFSHSAAGATASAEAMAKKMRGRPRGSGRKQQMAALGSAGIGFTPHVITVKAGEDVSSKIMSFSQHGPRAVCILSANGAISNVTLRQAATSGGTVTYEGRFEILSLSGSFLLSESGSQRSRTGGLSVSLAGPDGRVLGGGVAGLLTAASPVQVVVGSFIGDGRKESKYSNASDPSLAPAKVTPIGMTVPSSPPSRGTQSESSGGPGSPLNQSTGVFNNTNQHGFSAMPWK